MKKRLLYISQLCFGLTSLIWILFYPIFGSIYLYKSQIMVCEDIQSQTLYDTLRDEEKLCIDSKLNSLKALYEKSKIQEILPLFMKISPFELSWIILAIIVPILLLKQTEGSEQIIWLLPICTLLFIFENVTIGKDALLTLLPTEKYLEENYIGKKIKTLPIQEQRTLLTKGWESFLIKEWAREEPSTDKKYYSEQIEKGKFYFNLHNIRNTPTCALSHAFYEKKSIFLLIGYLLWNVFFAYFGRYSIPKKVDQKAYQIA